MDKNTPEIDKINYLHNIKALTDIYTQCIHCGMCLNSCPTYVITGKETSSPRGRIRLIKSVAEGTLPLTETFAYEMNFCLDCQACETACPAGVKYGKMIEAARVEVENHGYSSPVKSLFLKQIIPYRSRLRFVAKILRVYQQSGLQKLVRLTGILGKLFPGLAEVEQFSPDIPSVFSDSYVKEINPPAEFREPAQPSVPSSPPVTTRVKYKLAFSIGCLMDVMLPEVNKNTVELLNKLGALVISPMEQTCCGSLNAHNGDMKTAKELAKKNIDVFSRYNYDYLISNSAGCGAFMKEYAELFSDDPEYVEAAKEFSSKVKDLTEFLSGTYMPSMKSSEDKNVTYHDACHLVHTQKLYNEPREVLNRIKGMRLVPLEDSTKCCGSAGIYNLLHTETSLELLEEKMKNIERTNAGIVLTGNPGCLLQLKFGAKKFNINVHIEHTASFINKLL